MPEALTREVHISAPVVEQMFATARAQKWFATDCDDRKDKFAFQGKKELAYAGPEGGGSCTYNWSKAQSIQKLTATMESIAFTLEEGRRLAVEHKHDRLGLDAELAVLSAAVKDGRALEIENIRPELEAIIEDETVLERARLIAKKMLDGERSVAALD